jgi:hypothetical protein
VPYADTALKARKLEGDIRFLALESQAEQCWRRILVLCRPDQFYGVDRGIFGNWRRDLSALAAENGDRARANRLWREV